MVTQTGILRAGKTGLLLRNSVILVLVAMLLLGMILADKTLAADGILDSYENNNTSVYVFGANKLYAQTFIASAFYEITSFSVYGSKRGTVGYNLYYYIVNTDIDGKPVFSSVITQGQNDATTTALGWKNYSLPSGGVLESGKRYAIVLKYLSNTVTESLRWYYHSDGTLNGGQYWYSSDLGGTWTGNVNYDFTFRTYGTIIHIPAKVVYFDVAEYSDNCVMLEWVNSANTSGIRLIRSYINPPTGDHTGKYNIFDTGNVTTSFLDVGVFPYVDIYYRIYGYNIAGWSEDYAQLKIERTPMDVNVDFNLGIGLIGIILGLAFMFMAGSFRSPILWIAALVCFIGIYFEPDIYDTYYQVGAGIVMIFCLMMCTFHYKQNRRGG